MVFNLYETVSKFVFEVAGQSIEFVRLFKLLGVLIVGRLRFDDHILEVCMRVNSKTKKRSFSSSQLSELRKFKLVSLRIRLFQRL